MERDEEERIWSDCRHGRDCRCLDRRPAFTNFAWALPTFPDVTVDTDHHEHISWLAGTGITKGYPDGSFRPMEMVYRQDMAAFLYRIAGEPVFTPTEDQKAASPMLRCYAAR